MRHQEVYRFFAIIFLLKQQTTTRVTLVVKEFHNQFFKHRLIIFLEIYLKSHNFDNFGCRSRDPEKKCSPGLYIKARLAGGLGALRPTRLRQLAINSNISLVFSSAYELKAQAELM